MILYAFEKLPLITVPSLIPSRLYTPCFSFMSPQGTSLSPRHPLNKSLSFTIPFPFFTVSILLTFLISSLYFFLYFTHRPSPHLNISYFPSSLFSSLFFFFSSFSSIVGFLTLAVITHHSLFLSSFSLSVFPSFSPAEIPVRGRHNLPVCVQVSSWRQESSSPSPSTSPSHLCLISVTVTIIVAVL